MTKLSYSEVSALNIWNGKREEISTFAENLDFYNLKNKAEGARRYGYEVTVTKFTTDDGCEFFRGEYQTTLNGSHYQSGKDTDFYTTHEEVTSHLKKTIAGATKRYAKLAQDPVASKIEYRTELANATTCKLIG